MNLKRLKELIQVLAFIILAVLHDPPNNASWNIQFTAVILLIVLALLSAKGVQVIELTRTTKVGLAFLCISFSFHAYLIVDLYYFSVMMGWITLILRLHNVHFQSSQSVKAILILASCYVATYLSANVYAVLKSIYSISDLSLYHSIGFMGSRSSGLMRIVAISVLYLVCESTIRSKNLAILWFLSLILFTLGGSRTTTIAFVFSTILFVYARSEANRYRITAPRIVVFLFTSTLLIYGVFLYRGFDLAEILTLNNRLVWVRYLLESMDAQDFIFGLGYQADRVYLGESLSNAYVYLYSTFGIVGSVGLILLFSRPNVQTLKHIILDPIVGFFLIRGLTENSFGVYGIDFLIFSYRVRQLLVRSQSK